MLGTEDKQVGKMQSMDFLPEGSAKVEMTLPMRPVLLINIGHPQKERMDGL